MRRDAALPMADESLLDKVHDLSDLELAVLLCLISREHCIISTPSDAIGDLVQELQLVSSKTFGLRSVVIDCSPSTTLSDFVNGLLLTNPGQSASRSASPLQTRTESYFNLKPPQPNPHGASPLTAASSTFGYNSSRMANFVIAKNLDRAPPAVQIQALELLRTRRVFTRSAVQTAPKQFIFMPVVEAESGGDAHVNAHLNDFFYLAHWHDPEDGFVNLEEWDAGDGDETASTGSVVKRNSQMLDPLPSPALISEAEIRHLHKLSQQVVVDVDVTRYQMNIISFLRMHRAVASGMSPAATKHFGQLMRCLAPLHSLAFVTPSLVALAAKKVYLHRIRIERPEHERSVQWGSKIETVEAVLEDVGPEAVIEDVLEMVTAPL